MSYTGRIAKKLAKKRVAGGNPRFKNPRGGYTACRQQKQLPHCVLRNMPNYLRNVRFSSRAKLTSYSATRLLLGILLLALRRVDRR